MTTKTRTTPIPAADKDACAAWLHDITPATEETIDETRREYRTLVAETGKHEAVRTWFTPLFDTWLRNLKDGRADMDDDTLLRLAVGMNESLSMRDALINSIITDATREQLLTIAVESPSPETATLAKQLMCKAYDDENGPDPDRCRTGLAMLCAITNIMCDEADSLLKDGPRPIQQGAAIAYVLWWTGDEQAYPVTLLTLVMDDGCNLARLVLEALTNGRHPNSVH